MTSHALQHVLMWFVACSHLTNVNGLWSPKLAPPISHHEFGISAKPVLFCVSTELSCWEDRLYVIIVAVGFYVMKMLSLIFPCRVVECTVVSQRGHCSKFTIKGWTWQYVCSTAQTKDISADLWRRIVKMVVEERKTEITQSMIAAFWFWPVCHHLLCYREIQCVVGQIQC